MFAPAIDAPLDPFRHHPELRGLVTPSEQSFFRDFEPVEMEAKLAARGVPAGWCHSEADREACRKHTLASWPKGDMWVFAYGSLMWDPAIAFTDVRRARIEGYARRFCLLDTLGVRGTAEVPGLMAGLDVGVECHGLVFCIAEADREAETDRLWRRERIAPGYHATMVAAETDFGTVQALAFVADRSAASIVPDLPREDQIRYIATGKGIIGTSLAYIETLARQFDAIGIADPDLASLLDAARRYHAEQAQQA
ncbi:gamma-glutamylcyclotransferase [Tropicimonas sp. IMCC34043]|uniref:gamma-glutamylcyclotransferase n=1 Tax=Tropicimonas sp. IMCC34043 TaxID=2248760 RepID=UPI0013004015|nr:gamma-glutamylcyclotransferase [Tropicimonas sp. IMCC34043]